MASSSNGPFTDKVVFVTGGGSGIGRAIADVSDEEQIAAAVRPTVDVFGRLDMAFNNAGIMLPSIDAADEPASAFDKITATPKEGPS